MNSIRHQAISASAGSGKTFQLAHRYMRLLANEVRPDQINALTFSRKAAGEIFDSIVKYLREAAVSAEQARKTGELIGKPEFGQAHFLRLLRTLLVNLHRLHVSTLDSFTVGVIRTFPMELGISTDLQLLDNDGAAAKSARQEALGRIFDNRYVDAVAQRQFLEAFKVGAEGVMVVGCKSDGCHYEVGIQKAEKKVKLARVLLKEYGIEPERLELFNMVFIEGDKFAEAAHMMTERLEKLGSLELMGGS